MKIMNEVVQNSDIQNSDIQNTVLKLRDEVEVLRRKNSILLVNSGTGKSVRVSGASIALLPLLDEGCRFTDLIKAIAVEHPSARRVDVKLSSFLKTLGDAGLMENSDENHKKGLLRFNFGSPDGIASAFANTFLFLPRIIRMFVLIGLCISSFAVIGYAIGTDLIGTPEYLIDNFSAAAFLFFIFVIVPIHEMAHAVACRMGGVKVRQAGIIFHGNILPGPFVNTSQSYMVTSRWKRFWIPAAGPLINLLSSGLFASLFILYPEGTSFINIHEIGTLFFLSIIFTFIDTNPFSATDGSHMLEAWLDDELARRAAWFKLEDSLTSRKTIQRYKTISILHSMSFSVFIFWWVF